MIAAAPALQTVAPYAADLQTIAPYSAQLTTIAPYSTELTIMAPYSAQLTALSKVPASDLAYLKAHGTAGPEPRPRPARPVEELVVGLCRRPGPLHPADPADGRPVEPA